VDPSLDQALVDAAERLNARAVDLIAVRREDTGESTEQPAHDLARALAMWSICLRRLAEAGPGVWALMESGYPDGKQRASDPFAIEGAQVAMLSATVIGDTVLDAFAWAELVRRQRWRPWQPGDRGPWDRLPVLWSELMGVLDAAPDDPMTGPARFLDLTLDAARDMLVAHRDPELMLLRGASDVGTFSLHLRTMDDARLEAAFGVLRGIPGARPWSGGGRFGFEREVERLIGQAASLDRSDRLLVRHAYRLGGINLPDLGQIADAVLTLIDRYIDVRALG
jgi:hypothetical protein